MGKDQELLDAARSGNIPVVDKILAQRAKRSGPLASLRRGPGANVQDNSGYTPLHHAALNGHKEIVRLLLAADASPCLVDGTGASPLHLAAWAGHADIVRALLANQTPPVNVDLQTRDKETALHCAAQYGHATVAAQLLARGADPGVRNVRDESALDLAAQYGRLETVEILVRTHPELLEQYRPPASRGRLFPHTPLHRASKNGHKSVVSILILAGADVNARTAAGTALHEAALCGKAGVVRALLARGADASAADRRGRTVLDLLSQFPAHAVQDIVEVINKHRTSSGFDSDADDLPPIPVGDNLGSPYDNVRPFVSKLGGYSYAPAQLWERRDMEEERRVSGTSALSMPFEPTPISQPDTPTPNKITPTKQQPSNYVAKIASKCFGLLKKSSSSSDVPTTSIRWIGFESGAVQRRCNSTNTLHIGNSRFFTPPGNTCKDDMDTVSLDRAPATLDRLSVLNRNSRQFKSSLPNISEKTEYNSAGSSESLENSLYVPSASDVTFNSLQHDVTPNVKTLSIEIESKNSNKKSLQIPKKLPLSYAQLDFTAPFSYLDASELNEVYKEKTDSYETYDFPIGVRKVDDGTPANIKEKAKVPNENFKDLIAEFTARTAKSQNNYENVPFPPNLDMPEPTKRTIFSPKSTKRSSFHSQSSGRSSASLGHSDSFKSTTSYDSILDGTRFEDILLSKKSKSFTRKNILVEHERTKLNGSKMSNRSNSSVSAASSLMSDVDPDSSDNETEFKSLPPYLPMSSLSLIRNYTSFSENESSSTNGSIADPGVVNIPKSACLDMELLKKLKRQNSRNQSQKITHKPYHIKGTGACIYEAPSAREFIYIFNRDTLLDTDVAPFTKVPFDANEHVYDSPICFCEMSKEKKKLHVSADDLLNLDYDVASAEINLEDMIRQNELARTTFKCYCDRDDCKFNISKRDANFLTVSFGRLTRSTSEPFARVNVVDDAALSSDSNETISNPYPTLNSRLGGGMRANPYAVVDIWKNQSANSSAYSTLSNTTSLSFGALSEPSTLESKNHSKSHSFKFETKFASRNIFQFMSDSSSPSNTSTIRTDSNNDDSENYETMNAHETLCPVKSDSSSSTMSDTSYESTNVALIHRKMSLPTQGVRSLCVRSGSDSGHYTHAKSLIMDGSYNSEDLSSSYQSARMREADQISISSTTSSTGPGVREPRQRCGTSESSVSGGVYLPMGYHTTGHHAHSPGSNNKVSPTPPKKPPRRNLSVSPTHANSPASVCSYDHLARTGHARSQDDLDDLSVGKNYLRHGRSVDQYVDEKPHAQYIESDNRHSPRQAPVPNPRPSLKNRDQPVAITAMYENVVIKTQNPRRKLRRNFTHQYENFDPLKMNQEGRKNSSQEKSSLESLLDEVQSANTPSDCENTYYATPKIQIPLSPTHYKQPPTPDHPPPSARQAEKSIHERIRPLSQEYKRRSCLLAQRDGMSEMDAAMLRVGSAASDRSVDGCVEEFVGDVPFAGESEYLLVCPDT